jgi:hypothetical protein
VSAFRLLPIAWSLFDIRFHAGIEDALAVVLAVKARVEIVIAELTLRKFYRVWPYPRSTERLSGNLQRYDYDNRGLLEQRTSYNEPL